MNNSLHREVQIVFDEATQQILVQDDTESFVKVIAELPIEEFPMGLELAILYARIYNLSVVIYPETAQRVRLK